MHNDQYHDLKVTSNDRSVTFIVGVSSTAYVTACMKVHVHVSLEFCLHIHIHNPHAKSHPWKITGKRSNKLRRHRNVWPL